MTEQEKTNALILAQTELIKPSTIWFLFLFFGWSYGSMGKIGKQIFFWITLGGFGLWLIHRLFTLNSAIKNYNNNVYIKHGLNNMIKI